MHSFKVVAECPIIVVSIFQAHRTLAPKNVGKFTPRIKSTLLLQAGPQRRAHEDEQSGAEQGEGCAQAHGCHHLSVGLCGVGWIGWVVRVGC